MTSYTEKAQALRARQAAQVEDLDNRRDLSADGRKRQLAKIHARTKTEMKKLRDEAAGAAEKRRAEILSSLFGNPASRDPAAVVGYRDALDRAAAAKSPDEARSLLQLARVADDPELAKAVALRALDVVKGNPHDTAWGAVLDDWGSTDQRRDQLLTELGNLERDNSTTASTAAMLQWTVPRPAGLDNSDDIHKLARDADATPGEDEAPDPLAGFGWGQGSRVGEAASRRP